MEDQSFPTAMAKKAMHQEAVLVCVTDQRACERLIAFGAGLAERNHTELLVLNIHNQAFESTGKSDALEYLFQVSSRYRADMSIFYNADPIGVSNDFISRRNIAQIVTGMPSGAGHFVINLQQTFPHIPLAIVPPAGIVDIEVKDPEESGISQEMYEELLSFKQAL